MITGDVAEITTTADGKRSAHLVGGGNYYLGDFEDELTLVPIEAYPMLVEGRLDDRLFNLTQLVAQGYDDAKMANLPLMLTAPATSRSAPQTPEAATRRLTLASVGTTAVTVDKTQAKDFWNGVKSNKTRSGVSKIWLDGRTYATLDRSTKQIGAPTAWKAGYDGAGVKVAVLDTGYDEFHPDLKKQVVGSKSFVDGETVQDGHGHGTHTASTVAGLGAASDGKRKGVAPGAELLIAKVLGDGGSGLDSGIMAGMEWAVEQGAKVVSMSLGSLPSDGTDPMSQAVDRLSASSDALFVVAAGNSGEEETVGAPGAAAAALTVGAIDRDDKLAYFSSRGPRLGDGLLKPEVTAPGVEIAAARAAGTSTGRDLDEYSTTMSGTSMAAPHVAGAAAILAQKHPEWTGEELKAALVATAVSGEGATAAQQGLGRIDIPKALDAKILTDTANLSLGDLSWTGEAPAPVRREIAYRNNSRSPVTLDLSVDVKSPGGVRPSLKVSPAKLRIAPGASASASVTLDLAKTDSAKYAGAVIARAGGTAYRVGLGFAAGGRLNQVTVKGIGRDGLPDAPVGTEYGGVQLWNHDTGRPQNVRFDGSGSRTLAVPTGRYSVMAYVMGSDVTGRTNEVTLLGDPDELISTDRTFVFDARKANKVTVRTPRETVANNITLAWHRKVGARAAVSGFTLDREVTGGIYVQDFGKVTNGTFQVVQRWDLEQPMLTVDVLGAGGFRLPPPDPGNIRTPFVGTEELRLFNGGDGTAAELKGAEGEIALIRYLDYFSVNAQVQAAKDAGARAVFMYNDQPGFWNTSTESGIPFYLLRQPEGMKLLDLLTKRDVTLRLAGLQGPTYRYELAAGPSVIRGPQVYDFAKLRPAAVTTDFHQVDAWNLHEEWLSAHLPGISTAWVSGRYIPGSVTRTDYLASDVPGAQWSTKRVAGEWNFTGVSNSVPRGYRPNEKVTGDWWEAISRPAVPPVAGGEADGMPVARFENAIRVAIPQYVNGDRTGYGWADGGDTTSIALSSNGKQYGSKNWSVAQFPVPKHDAWYDLTLDVKRADNSWAKTSTATRTAWRFKSGPTKTRAVLPLVQVDYALSTGADNAVPARGGTWLGLKPGYQPGASGPGRFQTTAEISYDGQSWQRLRLQQSGPGSELGVKLPAAPTGAKAVNLRVTVADKAGNEITQTIEKAWLLN